MRSTIAGMLAVAVVAGAAGTSTRADEFQENVSEHIQEGVVFLRSAQRPDGTWPEHPAVPGGITALCTLALLNAGVAADDPQVASALIHVRGSEPETTYGVSLQTMVLARVKAEEYQERLRRNVVWFQDKQLRDGAMRGAWGYPQAGGDNSNSRFALLALDAAAGAGVRASNDTWGRALAYWLRVQNDDGSWGYKPGNHGTGSMTSAGMTSVIIASRRSLDDKAVPLAAGESVGRARDWLGRHFTVDRNPGAAGHWSLYYLHSLSTAGRAGGLVLIGQHDWYREGAKRLLNEQIRDGSWSGSGHAESDPHVASSLALLFLARRAPVEDSEPAADIRPPAEKR